MVENPGASRLIRQTDTSLSALSHRCTSVSRRTSFRTWVLAPVMPLLDMLFSNMRQLVPGPQTGPVPNGDRLQSPQPAGIPFAPEYVPGHESALPAAAAQHRTALGPKNKVESKQPKDAFPHEHRPSKTRALPKRPASGRSAPIPAPSIPPETPRYPYPPPRPWSPAAASPRRRGAS